MKLQQTIREFCDELLAENNEDDLIEFEGMTNISAGPTKVAKRIADAFREGGVWAEICGGGNFDFDAAGSLQYVGGILCDTDYDASPRTFYVRPQGDGVLVAITLDDPDGEGAVVADQIDLNHLEGRVCRALEGHRITQPSTHLR